MGRGIWMMLTLQIHSFQEVDLQLAPAHESLIWIEAVRNCSIFFSDGFVWI